MPSEEIEIIEQHEPIEAISDFISKVKKSIVCYLDPKDVDLLVQVISANRSKIMSLKSAGSERLKCITEITWENLSQCKDIMKAFELFHAASITGSFLISDNQSYLGFLVSAEGEQKLLRISNKSFVSTQRMLVDILFKNALPANKRITEIGKRTKEEFIETIKSPVRVKSLIQELLQSALFEVSILFSTRNSFLLAEKEGILEQIRSISLHSVKVRILVMHEEQENERVKEIAQKKLKMPELDVQINYLQQLLPTRITTFIVDQAKTLTIEINHDTKDRFEEAIGLSTYSNSESTVFSNASIFESLWVQAELDKQTKARQAYFNLFKGLKLKDELYNRRWSNQSQKDEKSQKVKE